MAITDKAVCPDMTKTPLFYIRNRDLVPAQQFPDIVVTQDSDSRKIHFIAPRYFDGADFSTKTISFRYTNPALGYDEVLAKDITTTDTEIEFTWLVPKGALVESGVVNFDVTVFDDANYEWHSKPYPLKVEIGLDIGTQPIEIIPDLYREWLKEAEASIKEMNELKTNASDSATSAADSAAAAKTNETAATNSANAAKLSAENAKASETNAKESETNAKASEDSASESKDSALDYANKAAATEIRVNAKATDVETNRQFVADAKQQVASDKTACEDAVTKCAGYVGYTKTGFIVKDDGKVQFIYYND